MAYSSHAFSFLCIFKFSGFYIFTPFYSSSHALSVCLSWLSLTFYQRFYQHHLLNLSNWLRINRHICNFIMFYVTKGHHHVLYAVWKLASSNWHWRHSKKFCKKFQPIKFNGWKNYGANLRLIHSTFVATIRLDSQVNGWSGDRCWQLCYDSKSHQVQDNIRCCYFCACEIHPKSILTKRLEHNPCYCCEPLKTFGGQQTRFRT